MYVVLPTTPTPLFLFHISSISSFEFDTLGLQNHRKPKNDLTDDKQVLTPLE